MTAKLTLLEMVQNIMSDMDRDEVNSLSDTVESTQIASIIRDTYYQLVSNKTIPELKSVFQLEALGDVSRPNYLKLPSSVDRMYNFRYNKKQDGDTTDSFSTVTYIEPSAFLDKVLGRDTSLSYITTVADFSGVVLPVFNDRAPTYWTSFDDEYIICDSFDSAVDTSLQQSKTTALGSKVSAFDVADDNFIPDMDDNLFPILLAEAKQMCFELFKQTSVGKLEQQARRQRRSYQNDRYRTRDVLHQLPNYGRRR